jgi:hypothetical protein
LSTARAKLLPGVRPVFLLVVHARKNRIDVQKGFDWTGNRNRRLQQ